MQPCKIVVLALVALLGAPAVGAAEKAPTPAVKPLKKKKPGQKVRAPPASPGETKEKPKTSTAALLPLPANYPFAIAIGSMLAPTPSALSLRMQGF